MKVVIQRVKSASVSVSGLPTGSVKTGLLVLLGVGHEDGIEDVEWLVNKIVQLRIFPDEKGLMNLSIKDVKGEVLLVSQFTLYASVKKGTRPSFVKSAKPAVAKELYLKFHEAVEKALQKEVPTGVFGADMDVNLVNWGPVTITMDSKNKE